MTRRRATRRTPGFRRVLDGADEDPLAGLANLFDAGVVLAVALSLALVGAVLGNAPDGTTARTLAERLRDARPLERFAESERELAGDGVRLGVAYRLASGEVVYVPEPAGAAGPGDGD